MGKSENNTWGFDGDTIQRLSGDIIIEILKCLNSPKDVAHATCVSRSWRKHVLEGSLWRGLCIKSFPEIANFEWRGESRDDAGESSGFMKIEKESRAYRHLLMELLLPPIEESCIAEALHASSTDNYPHESIEHTLSWHPMDADTNAISYWSSKGQESTEVPEALTYSLVRNLCVIREIRIQPFEAYFQVGRPIYSAKAVRFRFGYSRSPRCQNISNGLSLGIDRNNLDDYVWTYVSPEFPMEQESDSQLFQLPQPILCIGDVLHIELLGRVQTQAIDGLYYICVCHVSAHGRPLTSFDFKPVLDNEKKYWLKYTQSKKLRDGGDYVEAAGPPHEISSLNSPRWLAKRLRQLRPWNGSIIKMLLGNFGVSEELNRIDDEYDENANSSSNNNNNGEM